MTIKARKILYTGGSTAGHISPNIPLIKNFKKMGWSVYCITQGSDIEKKLLNPLGIEMHKISSGKLRRYVDFKNVVDVFRVMKGAIDSFLYIRKIKPNIIFSKGGYLALPVAVGAFLNGVPLIVHESDTIPSLTTKMTYLFTKALCTGFPISTKNKWKAFGIKMRTVYTGIPIRDEIYSIKKYRRTKNILNLLIVGGSLGAHNLNLCIRQSLNELTRSYNIIHVCGEGKVDHGFDKVRNYKQYSFLAAGIGKAIAKSDLVITRGGATFLFELLVAKKPTLIIPLSKKVSRGDQVSNAKFFKSKGYGDFISEEDLTPSALIEKLNWIIKNLKDINKKLKCAKLPNATDLITKLIFEKSN